MKSPKLQKIASTIRFSAVVVGPKGILTLPKSADTKLQSRETVIVEGMMKHSPFRAALIPKGSSGSSVNHELEINRAMREALGVEIGEKVAVEITRVGDEPEIRVPAGLRATLKKLPRAQASWMDITPMARRDWIFSICEARQAETRQRRIEKACDMLASGKRRLCCFPGVKWLMKKNEKTCGMWKPLSASKSLPLGKKIGVKKSLI